MFDRIVLFVVLFAASFAATAAKSASLPMPLGERLPVELVLGQKRLIVEVADNTGLAIAMGPLIPGLIDGISASRAEERIAPLLDALASYRFDDRFEAELRGRLVSDGISPDPQLVVLPLNRERLGTLMGDAPTYALVITPTYAMSQSFDRMYVQIAVQLVDRTIKDKGKFKSRIRAARVYRFSHLLKETRVKEHVAAWHSLSPGELAGLLDESMRHVIDMMVYDFTAEGRSGWDAIVRHGRAKLGDRLYGGLEVRRGDDWIWLRSGAPAVRINSEWVVNAAPYKLGINGFRVIDPVALASLQAPAGSVDEPAADAP
jgi:hypothetical protein